MQTFRKAIGIAILLTGIPLVHSYPSAGNIETYVSQNSLTNLLPARPSIFFFSQQMEDSIKVEIPDSIQGELDQNEKLKEPHKAFVYALVPGLVVHGAGHFYAGETTTGWILVTGEVLSLVMLTYAIGVGIGESTNGSTSNGDAEIVGIFAGTLFIGTWIYDIIGAPLAVQKYTEEFLRKKNVGLEFDFDHRSEFVKFQIVKRF